MQVAEYAQRLSPEAHSSKSWNTRAITDFSSATTEAATTSTYSSYCLANALGCVGTTPRVGCQVEAPWPIRTERLIAARSTLNIGLH